MSVCFLGTGAGSPASSRSTSGTLLKLSGTNYLFDAGEGIQRQLQFARGRSRLEKIDKIFITHMHGDHIFGLPGLLLSLQTSHMHQKSQSNTANVKIYGPPGLFNYIASSITLSCTKLHSLNVEKEEIINQKSASRRSRKFVSLEGKRHKRIHIKAAEVDHVPGVVTFGYVIKEDEPPHNLDVEKARSLGVSHKNMNYDLLKYGFPVIADMINNNNNNNSSDDDDGNARKIAFIGDNRGWTREMTDIARNADVLIHEATLLEEDYIRGHSTAAMAGRNGANCDAKVLILNHISP
ncbi:Metallo-hydrolase/oxidoreductase, partial [Fragilariopsis cylindrus CCMP1102]